MLRLIMEMVGSAGLFLLFLCLIPELRSFVSEHLDIILALFAIWFTALCIAITFRTIVIIFRTIVRVSKEVLLLFSPRADTTTVRPSESKLQEFSRGSPERDEKQYDASFVPSSGGMPRDPPAPGRFQPDPPDHGIKSHHVNNEAALPLGKPEGEFISWRKPPKGWYKLNTDGSARVYNPFTKSGAGGLIRDASGNWICGFSLNLGVFTSDVAELWAAYSGIFIAMKLPFIRKLVVEVDSQEVHGILKQLRDDSKVKSSFQDVHAKLKELILDSSNKIEFRFEHIPKERNTCADWLAKFAPTTSLGLLNVHSKAPQDLIPLLENDKKN